MEGTKYNIGSQSVVDTQVDPINHHFPPENNFHDKLIFSAMKNQTLFRP